MWHEARKQEKLVRNRMVDGAKRAERRRKYWESVRRNPEDFMQLHGRKCHIHLDANIARAAESSNILRKWQVDPKILIDRFDARSHLESIPTAPNTTPKLSQTEELEEIQADFERYRILILNEFQHYNEAEFLKQIGAKEFWNTQYQSNNYKSEKEKKKKATKAAIGFSYGNSEILPGSSKQQSDSESEEDFDEQEEYDLNFDVNTLSGERGAELSHVAQNFGRLEDGFIELLKIDQKERNETEQIREIDKAKSTLSGKYARSDRSKLKRQRALILEKVNQNDAAATTLLTLIQKGREKKRRRDSSSPESDSGIEKVKFVTSNDYDISVTVSNLPIRSFPKADSPKQSEEYQRLLNLKKHSESPDFIAQNTSINFKSNSPKNVNQESKSFDKLRSSSSSSSSSSDSSSSPSSADSRDFRPLDIRSSMSESEKERVEIENRKRRIEKTKRIYKEKERRGSSDKSEDEDSSKKAEAAKRLRKRMQKKLKNQLTQLKADEKKKCRETELKRRERDEILSDEARAIRTREREKRRELEGLDRPSRQPERKRESPSPKRHRSRSRERKYSRRSDSRERTSTNRNSRRSRSPKRSYERRSYRRSRS